MTHISMPPLVPLIDVRAALPGEASLRDLAQISASRGGYREAAQRRRGMRNF
jgi:hypothetical protein